MASLILLGILALYALFVLGVAYWGARLGYGERKSRTSALLGGLIGFLLAAAPLGWDTVPTLVAYDRNCETAGIKVLRTSDQWEKSNFEKVRKITRKSGDSLYDYPEERLEDGTTRRQLNSQFAYVAGYTRTAFSATGVHQVVDSESGAVQIEWRVVGTGKGDLQLHNRIGGLDDFKLWLRLPACGDQQASFTKMMMDFKQIGGRRD